MTDNSSCGGGTSSTDATILYPTLETTEAVTTAAATEAPTTEAVTTAEVTTEEPTTAPYVSPIDWESLWEKKTEIYAWLDSPDTEISYPVVQRQGDDTYYLSHDAYLQEYSGGSIMSESQYNSTTFEDRVNILYGHKMRSGAMLGTLQDTYSDADSFAAHPEVIIYLPDRELHYEVWMATSFDNYHLMETYDGFTRDKDMRVFLRTLRSNRAIDSQINEELDVTASDKLLVLSTCLKGKVSYRYLLISRLVTEQ